MLLVTSGGGCLQQLIMQKAAEDMKKKAAEEAAAKMKIIEKRVGKLEIEGFSQCKIFNCLHAFITTLV